MLSNTGVGALSVSSITISGTNAASFAQTNTCGTLPASLAVGTTGTCSISVTFNPATVGTKSATLTVVDGAGTHTVALSGTGAVQSSSLTPTTPLTFALQQTGTTSAAQVATLTNTSVLPLSVTSIAISGVDAADFAQTNNCGTSVAAGTTGSCTINVTFAPGVVGTKTAVLTVVDGAGTHSINLNGTGSVQTASLTPTTPLTFAAQQTGTSSAAQAATLSNLGSLPLSISSITLSGANAAEFAQTNTCGTSLASGANGSCSISITFNPATVGIKSATLTVVDGMGTQTVALNGTGAVQANSLTPTAPMAFSLQQTGTTSAAQVATLTNSGIIPLSVTSIAIGGTNAADFAQTNTCGNTLAVGANCTVNVSFAPATVGAKTATLTVIDGAGTHNIALSGTGAVQSVSLTPTTPLTFAAQQTGTSSAAQVATLTNNGVLPLSISSVTIGGTNPLNFTQTNNCGISLAAGANCTINVIFAPISTGAKTAVLTVVDAAGTHSINLDGTGSVQSSSLTPTTPLTFALQQTGTTSAAQVATLTNTSVLPLSVTSIAISGVDAADFAQTNNCGTSVAAGTTGSCTINVTFAPGVVGTKTAVLTVVDGAGTHSINLNGTGSVQTASLTPATPLTFAAQQTGTSSPALAATLTNLGSLPLSISSITLTGANAADFAQTNTCGTSLASGANGSCSISITFNPASVGTKSATLTVVDGMGTQTVALNGTGAVQANSLTPTAPMAFSLQQTGTTSAAQVATLTNSGIIPLSVTSIAIGGTNAADFAQTNNCGTTLAVGASCTVNVSFAPATVGAKTATLTVVDGAGTHNIALSGTGAVQSVSLTPTTPLTFAAQQTGTRSTAQVATLTNNGVLPLSISSVTLSGANAADFTQSNNCGASLAAAASCTMNVTFSPATVGTKIATLSVVDGTGTQTVALSGTGAVQSNSLTPTTPLAFSQQQTGTTSAVQVATLTNTSVLPLSVSSIAISGTNAADFAQTNNCGTSLAVGTTGTCTINVTFAPATVGTKSAILTVIDGAGTHTVALSGTGAVLSASLTPATPPAFTAQQTGTTSVAQVATLTNTSVLPLSVSSITLTGANAADFAQTNTCGTSLAAAASCSINVTLRPSTVGTKTAALTVVDGAGTRTIPLTGVAVAQPAMLNPATSLMFASQQVGATGSAQAVTLTNASAATLPISRITIGTTSEVNQFAQTNNCGTSLAKGASCTISVNFVPTTVGSKMETLTVRYAGGMQTVMLRGTAAAPMSTLTPDMPIVFGNQLVGTTSGLVGLTLTNNGVIPLSITSIAIESWGQLNQFAQTNNCGTSLAAGASCMINVSFTAYHCRLQTGDTDHQ